MTFVGKMYFKALQGNTTANLRKVLKQKHTITRRLRCHVYAELLRRKHSRS